MHRYSSRSRAGSVGKWQSDLMAFEYYNTFISVAEDCPVDEAAVPEPEYRGKPTVAAQEFEMLAGNDFKYTMSEVLSEVWVKRKGGDDLSADEREALRAEYFAGDRACFRASPLGKKFGWGFLFDADGRVAIVASDSDDYATHAADDSLDQLKAMRTSRK